MRKICPDGRTLGRIGDAMRYAHRFEVLRQKRPIVLFSLFAARIGAIRLHDSRLYA